MLLSLVHDPPARNVNLINLSTADLKEESYPAVRILLLMAILLSFFCEQYL